MKVYKYFHSRYKTAITMGFIYVNTFNTIRNQYENGQISDRTEGITENNSGELLIHDSSYPQHQQVIQDLRSLGAIDIQNSTNVRISNCSVRNTIRDAYMFCVTQQRNDAYWRSLPESQGGPYDCCIEILNFAALAQRLSNAFTKQGFHHQILLDKCFYEDNKGIISEGTTKHPSYFRKLNKAAYKKQQENRIVVIPNKISPLEPKVVYIETADLVRIIN